MLWHTRKPIRAFLFGLEEVDRVGWITLGESEADHINGESRELGVWTELIIILIVCDINLPHCLETPQPSWLSPCRQLGSRLAHLHSR